MVGAATYDCADAACSGSLWDVVAAFAASSLGERAVARASLIASSKASIEVVKLSEASWETCRRKGGHGREERARTPWGKVLGGARAVNELKVEVGRGGGAHARGREARRANLRARRSVRAGLGHAAP